MTKKQVQGLTLDGLRGILPFAMVLVSIVLAWASLNSYLSLLSARVDTINERVGSVTESLDSIAKETRETKEEVIRLAVIIEGAQSRGQISLRTANVAVASPTPMPLPLVAFNNNQQAQPQPPVASQPTPVPTSEPQPTPEPTLVCLPVLGCI